MFIGDDQIVRTQIDEQAEEEILMRIYEKGLPIYESEEMFAGVRQENRRGT